MEQISTLLPEGYDPNVKRDTENYLAKGIARTVESMFLAGGIAATRGGLAGAIAPVAYRTVTQTDTVSQGDLDEAYYRDYKKLGGSDKDYQTMQELYTSQTKYSQEREQLLAEVMKGLMSE